MLGVHSQQLTASIYTRFHKNKCVVLELLTLLRVLSKVLIAPFGLLCQSDTSWIKRDRGMGDPLGSLLVADGGLFLFS